MHISCKLQCLTLFYGAFLRKLYYLPLDVEISEQNDKKHVSFQFKLLGQEGMYTQTVDYGRAAK